LRGTHRLYRVGVAERAEREVTEAAAWWAEHRSDSPAALAEAVADGLERIAAAPYAHALARGAGRRQLRRHHLRRVDYFLYFRIDEASRTVEIVLLARAPASAAVPALKRPHRSIAAAPPARRPKNVPSPNDSPLE
jgi:hypothetical protein